MRPYSCGEVQRTPHDATPAMCSNGGKCCRTEGSGVGSVTLPDEIMKSWKASTRALGIRLTDEHAERLAPAVGLMHTNLAAILERANGKHAVPDYLANNRQEEADHA